MTDITDNDMAEIEALIDGLGVKIALKGFGQENINTAQYALTGAIMQICIGQREHMKHLQYQISVLQKKMTNYTKGR